MSIPGPLETPPSFSYPLGVGVELRGVRVDRTVVGGVGYAVAVFVRVGRHRDLRDPGTPTRAAYSFRGLPRPLSFSAGVDLTPLIRLETPPSLSYPLGAALVALHDPSIAAAEARYADHDEFFAGLKQRFP